MHSHNLACVVATGMERVLPTGREIVSAADPDARRAAAPDRTGDARARPPEGTASVRSTTRTATTDEARPGSF